MWPILLATFKLHLECKITLLSTIYMETEMLKYSWCGRSLLHHHFPVIFRGRNNCWICSFLIGCLIVCGWRFVTCLFSFCRCIAQFLRKALLHLSTLSVLLSYFESNFKLLGHSSNIISDWWDDCRYIDNITFLMKFVIQIVLAQVTHLSIYIWQFSKNYITLQA